jgi:G3E family GTPase
VFLRPEADQARIPVVVLTGFLGSGKTSLVNALLRDPRLADTAVAVNEFGDTPLDQHLMAGAQDSTVVLANGCLCCNFSDDLQDAVLTLFRARGGDEARPLKRLLVELSGLADPAPIAQAVLRNPVMSRFLRLEAIVTVVDALFAETQIPRHVETRKQISMADQLIVSKADLVEPAQLDRVTASLRGLNPGAPVHLTGQVAHDPTLALPAGFLDPSAPAHGLVQRRSGLIAESVDSAASHGGGVASLTLTAPFPLDWRAFDTWLRKLRLETSEALLRVKGLVNVAGAGGPIVVHGVHHVLHTPVQLASWPDADERTRIVLILQGADVDLKAQTWAQAWRDALPALAALPAAA